MCRREDPLYRRESAHLDRSGPSSSTFLERALLHIDRAVHIDPYLLIDTWLDRNTYNFRNKLATSRFFFYQLNFGCKDMSEIFSVYRVGLRPFRLCWPLSFLVVLASVLLYALASVLLPMPYSVHLALSPSMFLAESAIDLLANLVLNPFGGTGLCPFGGAPHLTFQTVPSFWFFF
jgi:hypothetical protein